MEVGGKVGGWILGEKGRGRSRLGEIDAGGEEETDGCTS